MRSANRQQRVENERVRAIYSLTSTLTATLNYHRVLESALDLSLTALSTDPEAGPEDRLVAAVLLFAGDTLIVGSARRFTTADMRVQLPGQSGILAQVINDGDAVLAKSASRDKELAHIVALRNCNCHLQLPPAHRLQHLRCDDFCPPRCRLLHSRPPRCD